jgi:hypothetical protein
MNLELSKRAVACKGWLWKPGMKFPKIEGGKGNMAWVRSGGRVREDTQHVPSDAFPDLDDPATVGAMISLWQSRPGHVFEVPCPVLTYAAALGLTHPTTVEAIVAALEAR